MPITFACACGRALRVEDGFAGRRVKCPACLAVTAAPAAPAEDDGFEVIDDPAEPPAPAEDHEFVVVEAPPPPPPTEARVNAVPVADDSPAPADPPKKPHKPKKKKRRPVVEEESARELYDRLRAAEAWRGRVFRGTAYIVLGVVLMAGVGYIFTFHRDELKGQDARVNIGLAVAGVMGFLAVGKGLFGLFLGQMFGDDE